MKGVTRLLCLHKWQSHGLSVSAAAAGLLGGWWSLLLQRILLLFSTGNNRMEVDGVVVSCLIIMHCNSDYSEVVYYLCIPGSHCGVPVTGQERQIIESVGGRERKMFY